MHTMSTRSSHHPVLGSTSPATAPRPTQLPAVSPRPTYHASHHHHRHSHCAQLTRRNFLGFRSSFHTSSFITVAAHTTSGPASDDAGLVPDDAASQQLHPTLQLLARRYKEGSRPGQRSDTFKLGLVVEGGGMRGVVSGAMLMGLRALGLTNAFDAVYGASAGAMGAAYFVSGQPEGLDIYTEDLVDGRFLDLSVLLPRPPLPLNLRSLPGGLQVLRGMRLSRPKLPAIRLALVGHGRGAASAASSTVGAAQHHASGSAGHGISQSGGSAGHGLGQSGGSAGQAHRYAGGAATAMADSERLDLGRASSSVGSTSSSTEGSCVSSGRTGGDVVGASWRSSGHHDNRSSSSSNSSRAAHHLPHHQPAHHYWGDQSAHNYSTQHHSSHLHAAHHSSAAAMHHFSAAAHHHSAAMHHSSAATATHHHPAAHHSAPHHYQAAQHHSATHHHTPAAYQHSAAHHQQSASQHQSDHHHSAAHQHQSAHHPSAHHSSAHQQQSAHQAAAHQHQSAQRRQRQAMDLSYLLQHVVQNVRPLDFGAVLNSPLSLKVVASSLDTLQPITFDNFQSREELIDCLAASATVPQLVGPPRVVRGHRCVDAAVFEPIPVGSALRDGCTHVLVLCTRSAKNPKAGGVSRVAYKALEAFVKRTILNASYMRDAWNSENSGAGSRYDEALYEALYDCPVASYQRLGAHVLPLYPESACGVHPICTDVNKLTAARREGYRTVLRHVGSPLQLRFAQDSCAARYLSEEQHAAPAVRV